MGLPTRQSGAGGTLRELTNADKHLGARQTGPPKSNFFLSVAPAKIRAGLFCASPLTV